MPDAAITYQKINQSASKKCDGRCKALSLRGRIAQRCLIIAIFYAVTMARSAGTFQCGGRDWNLYGFSQRENQTYR